VWLAKPVPAPGVLAQQDAGADNTYVTYDPNAPWSWPGQPQPPAGIPPPGYYPAQQPQFGNQPQRRDFAPQSSNGMATASLVLGITSIVFSWWGLLTLAQVILAVTFGFIGISKTSRGAADRGLAVAGLICGFVGLIIYFFVGLFSLGIGWII